MDQSESTAANLVEHSPMRTGRRWLQFSLRGFIVVLTAFAVWLGIVVNKAREQREAVEAIEALGGTVEYERTAVPEWLRQLIGDEYLQEVWAVDWASMRSPSVTDETFKRAIPQLKRLRQLDAIILPGTVSTATLEELKGVLPGSDVDDFFGDSRIVYTERLTRHYQQ